MSTYVMSDIHGCYTQFVQMLDKIQFGDSDKLILAGDYIDRGIDSLKMLKWIYLHFIDSNIIFLCGNHEKEFVSYIDLLLQIDKDNDLFTDYTSIDDCQFLYDTSIYTIKRKAPDFLKLFDIYNTLYCLLFIDKVPLSELITYTEMINKMSFYYRYNPKTIIVHAGFIENIEKSLGKYKSIEDFYLYARDDAYLLGGIRNGTIISGHTPTLLENEFCYANGKVFHYYNRDKNCHYYNIDCGISFSGGKLSCLRLEDYSVFYI